MVMLYWFPVNICTFFVGHVGLKVGDLESFRPMFQGLHKRKSSTDKRRSLILTKIGIEVIQHIIKSCLTHLRYTLSTAEEFIF